MDIPDDVIHILCRLKVYSSIKENEKPCITTQTYVRADSYVGSIYRTFIGESYETLIVCLNKDISDTISCIYRHKNFSYIIVQELENVIIGLNHLIKTYCDKRVATNKIDIHKERILRIINTCTEK